MNFRKETAMATADLALIKYWGKKDEDLRLPMNGSVSMALDSLTTTTTVLFDEQLKRDEVMICGKKDKFEIARVVEHLDRIRDLAKIRVFARVVSENSFPKATGLSSSGSGFAALTLAGVKSIGLSLEEKELSILARQGSGTACRCVCGGFVEWKDGNSSETSYSATIFPAEHWDLRDTITIVNEDKKNISSTEGHKSAASSPFYKERQRLIKQKICKIKELIGLRKFREFGKLIEAEALEFHSILLTGNPAYIAWYPGTLKVMEEVQAMRKNGLEAYFSINTGFNVHVISLPKFEEKVRRRLIRLKSVKKVLSAKIGNGPKVLKEHLF